MDNAPPAAANPFILQAASEIPLLTRQYAAEWTGVLTTAGLCCDHTTAARRGYCLLNAFRNAGTSCNANIAARFSTTRTMSNSIHRRSKTKAEYKCLTSISEPDQRAHAIALLDTADHCYEGVPPLPAFMFQMAGCICGATIMATANTAIANAHSVHSEGDPPPLLSLSAAGSPLGCVPPAAGSTPPWFCCCCCCCCCCCFCCCSCCCCCCCCSASAANCWLCRST